MKASNLIMLVIVLTVSCEDRYQDEKSVNIIQGSAKGKSKGVFLSARIADYTFDGTEGDPIPLETARLWAKNYREGNQGQIEAHFFGGDIIKQILAEEGCVGIRIYYAIDEEGQNKILIVGVNTNGDNLLPSNSSRTNGDDPIVADFSYPCPSFCPTDKF